MFKNFRNFLTQQAGNMGIIFAFAAVPVFGAAGGAIDGFRWSAAHSQLTAAMDGAVLAGTQQLLETSGDEKSAILIAQKYFDVAMKGVDLASNNVKFKVNSKKNGVASYGEAKLQTTFLKIMGFDDITLLSNDISEAAVAEASASAPEGDLEISVMLDVTGSMCDDGNGPCTTGSKLTALKQAASELVDTVIWKDQSKFTSKVALVPFSTRVRVAPDAAGSNVMKKLTNLEPTWSGWFKYCSAGSGSGGSETNGSWTCTKVTTANFTNWKLLPCVTDRHYQVGWKFELTDTAPGKGYWLNAHDGTRMGDSLDSSDTKATAGLGKTKSDPSTSWNYSSDGKCADVAESDEVMPLTNDKAALKNRINGLEAYGATGGVLGTAFSWYMLSPEWKAVWTGLSQPKTYDLLKQKNESGVPKLRKIAILMTDGSYNTMRGWKGNDINDLSKNALALCTNMKAKGIEIYTVGFALNSLPSSEIPVATNLLKSCGSSIDHFYNSINAEQLKAAFANIAQDVAEVTTHITK